MMPGSIWRNSLLLGLFAVLTTNIIAGTYLGTRDRIAEEQRKAREKALLEIVPRERHDNAMLDDTLPVGGNGELGLDDQRQLFVARRDGDVVAVILPVIAPDGYSGAIELIVGVNRDGSVAGARVLAHRETPGLGDKVDLNKSDWILGFDGRSLDDPPPERWKVRKDRGDFDQFTGATITPRAVTAAVKSALDYFAANRARLLDEQEVSQGG
jgi:electron transport complex protein RnfG